MDPFQIGVGIEAYILYFWQYLIIELYLTCPGQLCGSLPCFPASSCFLPLSCCHYCLCTKGFAFLSEDGEAFTFRHEHPLAVEASSLAVTSPLALCVSWSCCDSAFCRKYSRNADLPGILLQRNSHSSGSANELVGYVPHYISLYPTRSHDQKKAHEFAPASLRIVLNC